MQRKGLKVIAERDPDSLLITTRTILAGGIAVAPTDTIYGMLADALSFSAVRRLRRIRRPSGRPFIVLIPDLGWAEKLCLEVGLLARKLLNTRRVSVVLRKKAGLYHHLGRETVAVRIPREGFVARLLRLVARPLVAPSANPEGKPPARSIREAIDYFGDEVDLYVEGKIPLSRPSALISLVEGAKILRTGPYSGESLKRIILNLNGLPVSFEKR